ncbi:hypothetical protein [Paraliobacillus ryukyuensis]|uniref:hypothetical protein n=1 Tax=Paraliobacillus ryukyuensis TaxID=200904 RepID=UPI0009A79306|nr:hypothetical protein [Paraliobacillus ryukyuensis]
MKIERRGMQFDHLLVYQTVQPKANWQDGIFLLEDMQLTEGIYQNGPIFFSLSPESGEPKFGQFHYYMPINGAVTIDDSNADLQFEQDFTVSEALVMRQADQTLDFYEAEKTLRTYAKEHSITLKDTFYCVLLEVYGDIIIDLYIPIQDEGDVT